MLDLPKSTEFNRRIPKTKFYENLSVTPALRRVFVEQIKAIRWRNKIAATTLNLAAGKNVTAVLGFNTAEEVFGREDFESLGCAVTVTTADGSLGVKGFVTDALPEKYSYFYTCGPEPMLRAVYRAARTSGQFSFEERMGCGFGACMGCSCRTITGYKRICREGPVLEKEEILWAD